MQRHLGIGLVATVIALIGRPAPGEPLWQLTRIADGSTPIPDGSGTFYDLQNPTIEGNRVLFTAHTGTGAGGVYLHDGAGLSTVIDQTWTVPGHSSQFRGFTGASFNGDAISFQGMWRPEGSPGDYDGLYTLNGGDLEVIVDDTTPVPDGSGYFRSLQCARWIEGEDVGFRSPGAHEGIYTRIGGTFRTVADRSTPVPGGPDVFRWFWMPAYDDGHVAFYGRDDASGGWNTGIYADLGGGLHAVADENTPAPGGGTFEGFGWDVSLDEETVAFTGWSSDQWGLYLYDRATRGITAEVDWNTAVPDGEGSFTYVSSPLLRGGNLAFLGQDEADLRGLYAKLDGILYEVLDLNTLVDGRPIEDIRLEPRGFDGRSLAFVVRFADEVSFGVYRADLVSLPVPEPGALVLFGFGLSGMGAAGIARRRRRALIGGGGSRRGVEAGAREGPPDTRPRAH